jgi:hypothetical protein
MKSTEGGKMTNICLHAFTCSAVILGSDQSTSRWTSFGRVSGHNNQNSSRSIYVLYLRDISMSARDSGSSNTREWVLEPETEYRFELDPGSSLAIRVRPRSRPIT